MLCFAAITLLIARPIAYISWNPLSVNDLLVQVRRSEPTVVSTLSLRGGIGRRGNPEIMCHPELVEGSQLV